MSTFLIVIVINNNQTEHIFLKSIKLFDKISFSYKIDFKLIVGDSRQHLKFLKNDF